MGDDREDRDDAEEDCSGEADAVDDGLEVVCGRLARADAEDEAALLLEVLCDLFRVEDHGGVEEGEHHDQQEVCDPVEQLVLDDRDDPLCRVRDPCGARVDEELRDDRREEQDGDREDDRDDAGHVHAERKARGDAAHGRAAARLAGVLDGDVALALRDEHDAHDRDDRDGGVHDVGQEL